MRRNRTVILNELPNHFLKSDRVDSSRLHVRRLADEAAATGLLREYGKVAPMVFPRRSRFRTRIEPNDRARSARHHEEVAAAWLRTPYHQKHFGASTSGTTSDKVRFPALSRTEN